MTDTITKEPTTKTRKADVFRAAAELMVQKGYGGTSIADIGRAVGMTKAGLYHHIPSKQDMLFQIMQHALDLLEVQVIAPAKTIPDPEERLRSIIGLHIEIIIDKGQAFTVLFSEIHHLDDTQRETIVSRVKEYRGLIIEALKKLSDEGRLRDLNIEIASRHVLQTVIGIARWFDFDLSAENQEHLIEQTVGYSMAAILKH